MVSLGDQTIWQEQKLEHLRYEYDLKPEDVVLDIGSYRREFADGITKKFGCKVKCFDALDGNAAWTHEGRILMGGLFYYTSAFDQENQKEFKCVDIAPYLKDIALCKINIEGMEYALIEYMIAKGLIGEIKNIQVQFHLISGVDCEGLYTRLAEKLSKTHKITWRYPFVWENWERC
jgi:hypothetical protein